MGGKRPGNGDEYMNPYRARRRRHCHSVTLTSLSTVRVPGP